MGALVQIDAGDRRLLAAVADSMAEAARRSGEWLVCRPGCTQCCIGAFAITQLDARRLREGLLELNATDPARAAAVRARAEAYILTGGLPSDILRNENALPDSLDDIPCPALDPSTGCCDLYDARPMTCRAFGPVTQMDDGNLGACELCYVGATDEQMKECAVEVDPEGLESALVEALATEGIGGTTIVAYALRPTPFR
jgi:Fe-S-cluster containining protein